MRKYLSSGQLHAAAVGGRPTHRARCPKSTWQMEQHKVAWETAYHFPHIAGLTSIGVHNLSPGLVLTSLLLEGASPAARRFFNALAEEPETVAAALVPRMRAVQVRLPVPCLYLVPYCSPCWYLYSALARRHRLLLQRSCPACALGWRETRFAC